MYAMKPILEPDVLDLLTTAVLKAKWKAISCRMALTCLAGHFSVLTVT